jgi:hypothetical protein
LLVSRSASAEFTTHSFTVPPGHVEITGMPARPSMVALDISKDSDLTPFHLPLHVYFGVSDKMTLAITHEDGPQMFRGMDVLVRPARGRTDEDVHLHGLRPRAALGGPYDVKATAGAC